MFVGNAILHTVLSLPVKELWELVSTNGNIKQQVVANLVQIVDFTLKRMRVVII